MPEPAAETATAAPIKIAIEKWEGDHVWL